MMNKGDVFFYEDGSSKPYARRDWPLTGPFYIYTAPPHRCGTLTHDNADIGPHGAVRGLDWTGSLTFTPGGTAIIRGEKPESTYSGLKDQK